MANSALFGVVFKYKATHVVRGSASRLGTKRVVIDGSLSLHPDGGRWGLKRQMVLLFIDLFVYLFGTLEELPRLPHMRDVLGVLEDGHVVEGILGKGDQVCVIADLDPAALGRHAQISEHVGCVRGGGFDGLQGRHPAVGHGVAQLAAAVAQRHRVAGRHRDAQIRAERDLDAGLDRQPIRRFVVFGRLEHLAVRFGGH